MSYVQIDIALVLVSRPLHDSTIYGRTHESNTNHGYHNHTKPHDVAKRQDHRQAEHQR